MTWMFNYASSFNGDISRWDVRNVRDMSQMFFASQFNSDISRWDVRKVTDMSCMFFRATQFHRDRFRPWMFERMKALGAFAE
jgi:surface protein